MTQNTVPFEGKAMAQGELYIMKVDSLPKSAKPATPVNGEFIVGHSETGHHHVLDRAPVENVPTVEFFEDTDDEMSAYIKINDTGAPAVLRHKRDYDTHQPIAFEPGIYKVRRGAEYTPEGWKRQID